MEYILALGISLLINICLFLPAFFWKTDKLTDISYGLSFLVLASISLFQSEKSIAAIVLFILIALWSIRLSTYLLIRILHTKKDARFDGKREKFFTFLQFWILQAISVWIIMLPSIGFFSKDTTSIHISTPLIILGCLLWLAGIIIESIADQQKFVFKKDSANEQKWIATGLWKYARHPNYFGEILVWIGIYIFTISSIEGISYIIGILSPLYIIVLLRFVSGIPPLEKRYAEKYAGNKDYMQYTQTTNLLIPGPRKKQNTQKEALL